MQLEGATCEVPMQRDWVVLLLSCASPVEHVPSKFAAAPERSERGPIRAREIRSLVPTRAICAAFVSLLLLSCGGRETTTATAPSAVAPTPTPAAVTPTTTTPAATYTVSGTVRDDRGTPLGGAAVAGGVPYSKFGPAFSTQTDPAGQYRGKLPKGTYALSVSKPGFEVFWRDGITVSGDTVVDVTLHPGVYVAGGVRELGVDSLDDVKVEVVSGPNAGRSTLTGHPRAGQYFLDHLLPGEFRMRASKEGYESVEQVVNATANTTLDFTLRWAYGSCLRSVMPVFFDAYPSAGGSEYVSVDANAGRSWTAAPDAPWIEHVSPAAQTGSGRVAFRVLPQPVGATEARKGAVMIRCSSLGGQNVWISQNPDCHIHLEAAADSPATFGAAGGVGHLTVTSTPWCHWTARSQVDWMSIVGINDWRGDLDIYFVVKENPSGVPRTGLIVVGEATWRVTQQ
jgi:hypothetical protein